MIWHRIQLCRWNLFNAVLARPVTHQSVSSVGKQMKSFNEQKQFDKTLELFDALKNNGSPPPTDIMLVQALKACTQTGDLQRGMQIHRVIPSQAKDNPYIVTSLIHLYMQCGQVANAESLFNECRLKDVPICNAMMKGYVTQKMFEKAIDVFRRVKQPSDVTIVLLFNACAQLQSQEALQLVKEVLRTMSKSSYANPHCSTALLNALMKCGDVQQAESLFSQLTTKSQSIYGAMIRGYIKHGMFDKVLDLFEQMSQPSEMNVGFLFNACAQLASEKALVVVKKVSSNMPAAFYANALTLGSLLDALMKCADVQTAQSTFLRRTTDDLSLYAVMLAGYVKNEKPFEAISLFKEIASKGILVSHPHQRKNEQLIETQRMLYLSLINALADYADLSTSESVASQIPAAFLAHPHIRNALLHMWGKVGSVDKAEALFSSMSQIDHIGYTAMINAYGFNGMGRQAVQLFHRMPKEYIDQKTYTCVLNACSHSGLIDEARHIFSSIPHAKHQVYASMVDCLSRRGLFDEAKEMIERFEEASPPAWSMYMALLSGCRNYRKNDLAEEVYNLMVKHFSHAPESMAAAAVVFANTAASAGDLARASRARTLLDRGDAKKLVGLSWTTVNGKFYKFRAHDQSHPRSVEIHAEVKRMMDEAVQAGHQYNAQWVTRPLKPGETIPSVLCGHSEKLAIAWNFVENRQTTRIQVAKNLRVCGDCHAATKLIALARQCDIIVRDANRMHHFGKDGKCSCNEYF